MAGEFILERLKEKFGDDEEEEEEGFPDMNYLIGNSSAMDVGEFPTPMDERIGYASMTGGNVMELQITNPATFSLERDAMVSTIHQLGLNVTTHPDMNAGFCTAEKSARGEEYGYETIEQYFTDYLQELAQFKKHVEREGPEDEPLFEVGRMNPHISTSPMPSLEERMANDVGVDPFGFQIDEYNEEYREMRNEEGQNIWENEDFMRKFYNTFLKQMVDQKWQLFTGRQGLFTQYSDKFDRIYRDTIRKTCDEFYEEEIESAEHPTQARVSLISTAARADVGVQNEWLNKIDSKLTDSELKDIKLFDEDGEPLLVSPQDPQNPDPDRPQRKLNIEKLSDLNDLLPPNVRVTRINALSEALYRIRNGEFEQVISQGLGRERVTINFGEKQEKIIEILLKEIREKLDDLWAGRNGNDGQGEDKFLITVQGKLQALSNNMDVEVDRIRNRAAGKKGSDFEESSEDSWEIDEAAEELMAGNEKFFINEDRYYEFLRALLGRFSREIWKESYIFYFVIPAWMSESEKNYGKKHLGWRAPKFIWETLIENQYEDIDLKNPTADGGYFDHLQESDEFQRDVAAAVGACYAWAHFTQRKSQFDLKGRDFGLTGEEQREVRNEGWTWIRWMNRFGLGVNLETMQGSPQMRFKVWRPKDIAVTCHAINMTTREVFDEEELNDEIDGRPAKFTIDMEHVASLGAPPLKEMEIFVDQEEALAKESEELDLDPDKPVSTILRQMHLMDPGVEGQRGTHHGAFERGNTQLYEWLYFFVENGFARNKQEAATVLFELAEHNDESSYMMRLTMNMIEEGIKPEELDPSNVSPGEEPEDEKEAMIARFFGMEQVNYNREWAKVEEHAFDPLKGLLEAEEFDYTFSSKAAVDQGQNRPQEWQPEEYQ